MTDPRGSVIAIANSSGTVTGVNKYDDYGAPASGNLGRFQFTGQMVSLSCADLRATHLL